jgi:hypothetical protein
MGDPPEYELMQITNNRSYLIEYPIQIMEEKIKRLDYLLQDTFEQKIVSHRSGRWALNQKYIELLEHYGYVCDCSCTPGINWNKCLGMTGLMGTDYSNAQTKPNIIGKTLLEVPVTIRNLHYFDTKKVHSTKTLLREISHLIRGKQSWIRPSNTSLYQMEKLVKKVSKDSDYAMFMIHSSELMPGGSPYFKDNYAVESLYEVLEALFEIVQHYYKGSTLKQYAFEKIASMQ